MSVRGRHCLCHQWMEGVEQNYKIKIKSNKIIHVLPYIKHGVPHTR